MDPAYEKEITEYRSRAEESLRGPEGWLTVVGLFWLKQGDTTIGSDPGNAITLAPSAAKSVGTLSLLGEKVSLTLAADVEIDGTPLKARDRVSPVDLNDDAVDGVAPATVKSGHVKFFVIKRKNGIAVRVKDEDSEARRHFSGRRWYAPNPSFRIDADWVPFDPPRKVGVPDVLGNINEQTAPGLARFTVDGETVELTPIIEGDSLFFVFRDHTSAHETYGAARFLNTRMPENGHVLLDFNRAVNPPCAFTAYATCPIPMKENVLNVAIRAGELKPDAH